MKEANVERGSRGSVLIVEDDLVSSFAMSLMLKDHGFEVKDTVMSADHILEDVEKHSPDYILMDIRINGKLNGIQATNLLREKYQIPVIFISAFNDEETKAKVNAIQNSAFINKPYEISQIVSTIETFH